MSTRRARIKAVTALPPRRKNIPTAESTKQDIATTDSVSLSPKAITQKKDEVLCKNLQQSTRQESPKTSHTSPISFISQIENVPTERTSVTPKLTENVFASPLIRNSPKRTFASPKLRSPKNIPKIIEVPNCTTPLLQGTPKHQEFNQNTELQVASNSITKINQNSGRNNSRIEVYNVTRLPESVTDNAMDGIVPLQPARSVPKPIEKLKSEIISENAEVLFDPIVPLPSPNKVRLKLRPVPRLGPRRNSVQGSASESEDESRRSLLSGRNTPGPRQRHDSQSHIIQSILNREVSRVRNDSVSSSLSQVTGQPMPASPSREKSHKARRAQEAAIRRTAMAASRRRRQMKREDMTMYDLIFYNPSENPIIPDQDELKAKEESAKDLEQQKLEMKDEDADTNMSDAAPAPQIKLGPNGEIVLDESSLVIKQTQTQKISSVVREGAWLPSQGKYKRAPRTAEWSAPETVRFYRALAAIGTDFTLMASLFPDRTRKDLKLKFKKEEKLNGAQVDRALRSRISWDAVSLEEEFAEEREKEKRRAEQEKEREKERFLLQKNAEKERIKSFRHGMKRSRGLAALEVTVDQDIKRTKEMSTIDDIIERAKKSESQPYKLRRTQTPLPKIPIPPINYNVQTPIKKFSGPSVVHKVPTPLPKSPVPSTFNDVQAPLHTPSPSLTLAMINNRRKSFKSTPGPSDMATLTKINTPPARTPELLNNIPTNIETGSLIVLTVNNPKSPGKKMLQTYIAHEPGKLTQVALPTMLLNSVVGYMKKGTPKGTVSNSSSPLMSPNTNSSDSRTSTPSGKCTDTRKRNSSFSITEL